MSDGRTFARRVAIGAGALAIITSLLAASPALAASKPKPKATTTTTTKPKPKAPGIGSTLVVLNQDKQYEAVQLQTVTDPAQSGDGFSTPDAGKRYVGVTISIHNRSKGTDTGDANNNLTVVGSNNQVYQPDFTTLAGCTNFASGEYTLTSGTTEVGCVAYQVPTGVKVAKVQYNPNSGFSTNDATWTLP